MKVTKRDGQIVDFNPDKTKIAISNCLSQLGYSNADVEQVFKAVMDRIEEEEKESISVETIQDLVETSLMDLSYYSAAKSFILYRKNHEAIRDYVRKKTNFIAKYKESTNTANATVDDNSNVANKNI